MLWTHRLDFAAGGAPLVTVRLMEGQREVSFRVGGRGLLRLRRGVSLRVRAGQVIRVRVANGLPAALSYHPLLGDAAYGERDRLDPVRALWEARGVVVQQRLTGGVYGIAGRVVDNRRLVLVAAGDGSERFARDFAEDALSRDGARTGIFTELVNRPSGRLEVLDVRGRHLGTADTLATLEVPEGSTFTVSRVEHDVGYAAHGFTDRTYHGRLHVTVDASGRLAVVLAVTLEELLRGLVPSEIPAGSPRAALAAQAVTARSNVLAQIGTRHLNDPYVLCAEVHCQSYRGDAAQTAPTDLAVRSTTGEALFGRDDHVLVDAVYSAVCGGHGEDNDSVWPTLANASLRGHPDMEGPDAAPWQGGLHDGARLRSFLATGPVGWCGRATGLPKDRYRWERRFTPTELGTLTAGLGVGAVRDVEVTLRGASGRARSLLVVGERGRAVVEGELRIRRMLRNLPSAMFVVDREGADIVLRGGGWGHGVGMCQWGAIGRAQAGQDHHEILRAYYAGAEPAKIY